jgi:CHRD domain
MKRLVLIALVLAFGISCDDSPTSPSDPNVARFTAILLPSNEVPAITNADAAASGTMQLTMTVTRDAANVITGATYDFTVNMTGFPANTTLTGAHIHSGASGVNAPVTVNLAVGQGEFVLPTGQLTFSRNGVTVPAGGAQSPATVAQAVFNNPAGNYFNVHTTLNTGGAIRGQLVKSN